MKTLKDLFEEYCKEWHELYGKEIKDDSFSMVLQFIAFSEESCYLSVMNQEVIDDWCIRGAKESQSSYDYRLSSLRWFVIFINRHYKSNFTVPLKEERKIIKRRKKQTDKPFLKTDFSDYLEEYVSLLKKSGRYHVNIHADLIRFNKRFASTYGTTVALDREKIDIVISYLYERNTSSSYMTILNISRFLEYTNFRGYTKIEIPNIPTKKYKRQRTPYPFSDSDLERFFDALNHLPAHKYESDRQWKFRRMQMSMIFRLLFSTGMRTIEARELKRENIDWRFGIINIMRTKGHHEHRVAMHPSLNDMLKRYDEEMDKFIPNRTYMFPTIDDNAHCKVWITQCFNEVWNKMSDKDARAYDFRSNYAVRNINSWQLNEPKWIDKFMFLSRSMGHDDLSSTAYYYQLVPMFREKLQEQTAENLSKLIPDMDRFLEDPYFDYEEDS